MELVVIVFMAVMAVAIGAMWSIDIRAGRGYVTSAGLVEARDPVNGNRMVMHWLAEYGTAAALAVGAIALFVDLPYGGSIAAAALGALAYTSVNSLAWVLAEADRRPYAIPMVVGLVGALISLFLLAA